ncbi:MAG: protein kinase [Pirellulales bacterium]
MPVRDDPDPTIELLTRGNSGCYGAVWKARQSGLDRDVAVKILHPSMAAFSDIIEHARGLARAGQHPNVVSVHLITSIAHPETAELVDVVVMEWIEGGTLDSVLQGSLLSLESATGLCNGLIAGLEHLHAQGLTHGDLHQGNVVLSGNVPKLIDIDYSSSRSLALLSTLNRDQRVLQDIASLSFLLSLVLQKTDVVRADVLAANDPRCALTLADLKQRLGRILQDDATSTAAVQPSPDELLDSLRNRSPSADSLARRFTKNIASRIDAERPRYARGNDAAWPETFVSALEAATDLVADFSDVCLTIAAFNAESAATAIHREFGAIVGHYEDNSPGSHYDVDTDYAKFLGHELYLCLIAALLNEDRLEAIGMLLHRDIFVPGRRSDEPASVSEISEYVRTLAVKNERDKTRFASPHGELLKQRHSIGRLGTAIPFYDLVAAEFLVVLANERWRPWTALYLRQTPRFLVESRSRQYADRVCAVIGVGTPAELVSTVRKRTSYIGKLFSNAWWHDPFDGEKLRLIGTQ